MTPSLRTIALIISTTLGGLAYGAEQKILFCSDSISYNNKFGQDSCSAMCLKYTGDRNCPVQRLTTEGWAITSTSPKSVPEGNPDWGRCECVGTQYILTKPDKILAAPASPPPPSAPAPELALANKEIELLKQEVVMLKKEIEIQKRELDNLKAASTIKKK